MRLLAIFMIIFLSGCVTSQNKSSDTVDSRIQVQTTLFPLYDFARTIGGDKANVKLLLPPGAEPHAYEPTPKEVIAIKEADLFIYTDANMEPWVRALAQGGKAHIIEASQKIEHEAGEACDHEHHNNHEEHNVTLVDPHIWTSPVLAGHMVDNILAGFIAADSSQASYYTQRADSLKTALKTLDSTIRTALEDHPKRTLYTGGHFAFRYFIDEYDLDYASAYKGTAPSSEPSPKEMVELIQAIEKENIAYLFFEELINPKVARTIARETGAKLLLLHGAHNVSKEELASGITYIAIMEQNLVNIKKALDIK